MGYANEDMLVSPEWLNDHKDDPNLIIVDCPWEYYSYTRAHIPGAVCRPGHPHIKSIDDNGSESVLVATVPEVEKLLSDLGIGTDSTVVAYDDWGSIFATRLRWVLKYYGFDNVKVLNGGWQNWVASGFSVSFATPKPQEIKEPISLKPDPNILITREVLLEKHADSEYQVLDVRSEAEYEGRAAHGNSRTGHVPGATNLEWCQFLENSYEAEGVRTLKSADEIKSLLDEAGVDGSRNVVTHCQAAVRATFTAFVLELMGYDPPKVYDGSMAEWANRDDTPLE